MPKSLFTNKNFLLIVVFLLFLTGGVLIYGCFHQKSENITGCFGDSAHATEPCLISSATCTAANAPRVDLSWSPFTQTDLNIFHPGTTLNSVYYGISIKKDCIEEQGPSYTIPGTTYSTLSLWENSSYCWKVTANYTYKQVLTATTTITSSDIAQTATFYFTIPKCCQENATCVATVPAGSCQFCDVQNPPQCSNACNLYSSHATSAVAWGYCVIPCSGGVSNPQSSSPDWCNAPFQYILSWTFDGTQSAKQIQVSTDSNFNNLVYDSQKVTSSITSYTLPAAGSGLQYNHTYYWRVKAWNNSGVVSAWSSAQNITTPHNAYPTANFNWDPENPKSSELVQFADQSTGYSGNLSTNWSFEGGTPPSSTSQNPLVYFAEDGTYTVNLTATDNHNYSCSIQKEISVGGLIRRIWKEIIPW